MHILHERRVWAMRCPLVLSLMLTAEGCVQPPDAMVSAVDAEAKSRLAQQLPTVRTGGPSAQREWLGDLLAERDGATVRTAILALLDTDTWAVPGLAVLLRRSGVATVALDVLWDRFPSAATNECLNVLTAGDSPAREMIAMELARHGKQTHPSVDAVLAAMCVGNAPDSA